MKLVGILYLCANLFSTFAFAGELNPTTKVAVIDFDKLVIGLGVKGTYPIGGPPGNFQAASNYAEINYPDLRNVTHQYVENELGPVEFETPTKNCSFRRLILNFRGEGGNWFRHHQYYVSCQSATAGHSCGEYTEQQYLSPLVNDRACTDMEDEIARLRESTIRNGSRTP
jgi:hypothetical protein